jgi:hypothetical protein
VDRDGLAGSQADAHACELARRRGLYLRLWF